MGNFNKGNRFGGSKDGKKFGGQRDFGKRSFGGDDRHGGGDRSFGGNRGGNRSFGGDRDRERSEMFSAVCSDCGKKCEVPFRPTGDKPVFCDDCFRNKRGDSARDNRDRGSRNFGERNKPRFVEKSSYQKDAGKSVENYKVQFEILNAKLDKILKAVIPAVLEKTNKEETPQSKKFEKTPPKEVKTVILKQTLSTALDKKPVAKKIATKKTTKIAVKMSSKKPVIKKIAKKKK
ncbi:MAG: CxxC-x17-CxxC domain-containing protein [Patescibacteria group bacterium]